MGRTQHGFVMGNEVIVEYRQPLTVNQAPALVIDQVVQGYRTLGGWLDARGPGDSGGATST